jgi:putative transposase
MIVGGVADHVHILFALSRRACVADLAGDLNASSSKWLKAQGVTGFARQRGYGCFSVSQ